jgi:hypothetical protein
MTGIVAAPFLIAQGTSSDGPNPVRAGAVSSGPKKSGCSPNIAPMKRPRVIIKTVSRHHQIYIEHNGERTLYAVTDKLEKAKNLVLKAKRELGIARGSASCETWPIDPASEGGMKTGPRPKRVKGTWYVSFKAKERLPGVRRHHPRVTKPFRNEQEAKAFAKTKLAEGLIVSAGTLNPHQPKRTIASAQMLDWLEPNDKQPGATSAGL